LRNYRSKYIGTPTVTGTDPNTGATFVEDACPTCFTEELTKHFSDKFSCMYDEAGVYDSFLRAFYGPTANSSPNEDGLLREHYCCGIMANGLRQCDLFDEWSVIAERTFTLCEPKYEDAFSTITNEGGPKLRRDLCCENDLFSDCNLCTSFMVWDFTVDDYHGGDGALETELAKADGIVTDSTEFRTAFNNPANQNKQFSWNGFEGAYPPYAYANEVYPLGYARGRLREFNDPPICVYAPNTAGRVIEIKVEPDEIGNTVCVDDLHEDSLERNNPGVTQACDDTRLRTCFPDASTDPAVDGFAFLISCSESCADGDVDLWFRLRASTNKWTEAGDASKGTDRTELNTEMWCMWGISDMRDSDNNFELSDSQSFDGLSNLDGDFSKWDRWPSDLTPPSEPRVTPYESSSAWFALTLTFLLAALAF